MVSHECTSFITMRPREPLKCKEAISRDERKTSQGFVDIKEKTIEQLDELIDRQNKLLQNRLFVEKLPDKGHKIFLFKGELEKERLRKQNEYDTACNLLFNLTLNDRIVDEIEWCQEKADTCKEKKQVKPHEENYEEGVNLLKVVANHSGTASGKNVDSSLSISTSDDTKKMLYVDKFCEKYGKADKCKERFKPNQLRNNDKTIFISSAQNVKRMLGGKWEITEATPPVPVYGDTKMIGLAESLKLQQEQAAVLKDINKKYAVEKLLQNKSIKMGEKLPVNNTMKYRSSTSALEQNGTGDEDFESDDESDDSDHVREEEDY